MQTEPASRLAAGVFRLVPGDTPDQNRWQHNLPTLAPSIPGAPVALDPAAYPSGSLVAVIVPAGDHEPMTSDLPEPIRQQVRGLAASLTDHFARLIPSPPRA